jgi:hypothetical protein
MPKIILNCRPKWTKTNCKTAEQTSGPRRNRSVKAPLVTDDDDDDDDDDVPYIVVL